MNTRTAPLTQNDGRSASPYTKNVKRGAALLDREQPGWRDQIDLSTLNLSNGCFCVLGQVFGLYEEGLCFLWNTDVFYDSSTAENAVEHGFTIDISRMPFRDEEDAWRALQEAWVKELGALPQ
jgi:hypothetical protein